MRARNYRKALQNWAAIVSTTDERAASPANTRTACSTAIRRTGPIDFFRVYGVWDDDRVLSLKERLAGCLTA